MDDDKKPDIGDENKPDLKLVESVIEDMGKILSVRKPDSLEEAFQIGDLLMARFFGSDPPSYVYGGKGNPSFMAFLYHRVKDKFGVGPRTIRNYIRVTLQRPMIPTEAQELGLGQRIAMITASPSNTRKLASQAVKENWSFRRIQQEVKALQKKGGGGKKRKRMTPLVGKWLGVVEQALELCESSVAGLADDEIEILGSFAKKTADYLDSCALAIWKESEDRRHTGTDDEIGVPKEIANPEMLEDILVTEDGKPFKFPDRSDEEAIEALDRLKQRIEFEVSQQPVSDAVRNWLKGCTADFTRMAKPAPKGRLRWYIISTYIEIPKKYKEEGAEDWGEFFIQQDDKEKVRCVLQAPNTKEAEERFRRTGLPLLNNAELLVQSENLLDWLKRERHKFKTIKSYLEQELSVRYPTLEEFIVENTPKSDGHTDRKNKSP